MRLDIDHQDRTLLVAALDFLVCNDAATPSEKPRLQRLLHKLVKEQPVLPSGGAWAGWVEVNPGDVVLHNGVRREVVVAGMLPRPESAEAMLSATTDDDDSLETWGYVPLSEMTFPRITPMEVRSVLQPQR